MLKSYTRLLDRLQAVLRILTIILFITLTLSMFLQICVRVTVGGGFIWAEELAKYSMIWLTMLTLGLASRWNQHYKADFLYDIMPPWLCKILKIFIFLLQFFFIIVMFVEGIEYIGTAMGGRSPGLRIPMSWMYISIPVGAVIMFLYTLEYFFTNVLSKDVKKEEKQWES